MTALPASIGDLSSLQVLMLQDDCDDNVKVSFELPETIHKLGGLEWLWLGNVLLKELPAPFGSLKVCKCFWM